MQVQHRVLDTRKFLATGHNSRCQEQEYQRACHVKLVMCSLSCMTAKGLYVDSSFITYDPSHGLLVGVPFEGHSVTLRNATYSYDHETLLGA